MTKERAISENMIGRRFGMLTVIENAGRTKYGNIKWLCKCDCGEQSIVVGSNLKSGNTKSCGCYRVDIKKKHGLNGSRLAHCYDSMKTRCYNKNFIRYDRYGGRGIKVCDEWLNDFESFVKWALKNGYRDDLTLDRIDNDGDYEPDNCRWASKKEQANNTRTTVMIEIDGVVKPLQEWCEIYGIKQETVHARRRKGRRGRDLFKPVRKGKYHAG